MSDPKKFKDVKPGEYIIPKGNEDGELFQKTESEYGEAGLHTNAVRIKTGDKVMFVSDQDVDTQ